MYKAVVFTMTLNVSRSCDEWTAAMTTRDVYLHVRYSSIDTEWEDECSLVDAALDTLKDAFCVVKLHHY